jgi:N-acetylglutamate synthase (EC 2.3.1.1)
MEALENKAASLAIERLIALTYVPIFFHKLGYKTIDRSLLPEKIWRICIRCPKFFLCDEVAVVKDIVKKSC